MTYVSRDPFARTELHREVVPVYNWARGCGWCGQLNGHGKLFAYRTESDGGRRYEITGQFCSVACMRAYHT